MPPWRAIRRRELSATLRKLGFEGPYSGGKHEFMSRGTWFSRSATRVVLEEELPHLLSAQDRGRAGHPPHHAEPDALRP
jgi:hypothetical protein